MVKISTIFALGLFIAFMPFTGLPIEVKNLLYIASGLVVTGLSVMIRKELEEVIKHLYSDTVKTDTFAESKPKEETEASKN